MSQNAQCAPWAPLAVLIVSYITGCAGAPPRPDPLVTPQFATLVNTDIVISAVNGEWKLESGGRVEPSDAWDTDKQGQPDDSFNGYKENLGRPGVYAVEVAKGTETFYGVLAFAKVSKYAIPSAQNRWAIEIPEQYFAGARNGGISFVFGTHTREDSDRRYYHWLLWLSDIRLWKKS